MVKNMKIYPMVLKFDFKLSVAFLFVLIIVLSLIYRLSFMNVVRFKSYDPLLDYLPVTGNL